MMVSGTTEDRIEKSCEPPEDFPFLGLIQSLRRDSAT
jgi:hypothetical protein